MRMYKSAEEGSDKAAWWAPGI